METILKVMLTSLLSATALFAMAKLLGHKQVSQLDFFDYVSGITVGSIAAELATELEEPIRPLIALAVYCLLSMGLNFVSHKLPKTRKYINGTPTILLHKGKLYRQNMKKANLDLSEFMLLCREQGYFHLSDIDTAVFEYNGKLSILPAAAAKPVTPEDLKIPVEPTGMDTEVIMDGRILSENLIRMKKSPAWLEAELTSRGYGIKQIFLGLINESGQLILYENE